MRAIVGDEGRLRRLGPPAQGLMCLMERDPRAGLGARDGGSQPSKSPADDRDVRSHATKTSSDYRFVTCPSLSGLVTR